MGFHGRPHDGVHTGLIAASLGFKPFQNVIINAQGDGTLGLRHHDVGMFPERLIRRLCVGVGYRPASISASVIFLTFAQSYCESFGRLLRETFTVRSSFTAIRHPGGAVAVSTLHVFFEIAIATD